MKSERDGWKERERGGGGGGREGGGKVEYLSSYSVTGTQNNVLVMLSLCIALS